MILTVFVVTASVVACSGYLRWGVQPVLISFELGRLFERLKRKKLQALLEGGLHDAVQLLEEHGILEPERRFRLVGGKDDSAS